jgi:ABC-type uncharacterized transport system involved in gliding motility auxiliary subunit
MQIDLTENGLYTISKGNGEHPRQDRRAHQPVLLLLERGGGERAGPAQLRAARPGAAREFTVNSHGKLSLKVIDPVAFSEAEDDAARFGLQGVPVGQTGDTLYFGLARHERDRQTGSHPLLRPRTRSPSSSTTSHASCTRSPVRSIRWSRSCRPCR